MKRKPRPEVIIEGQVSVYWFCNNKGLPYDKQSLILLGRAAGARCNESGIVMGVKSQKEVLPDITKWRGRVRTYPMEILESLTYSLTTNPSENLFIKPDDAGDKELPAQAIIFERQGWTCPVCGLNRNKGNHQECSKITQLRYQQERAKKATKPI